MVSTWNEYLCLNSDRDGQCRVEVCQYEALAEFDWADEDGNEREVPTEYEGQQVVGVEDGYLVGGELACGDDRYFEYDAQTIDAALAWIKEQDFDVPSSMREFLVKFSSTSNA